MGVRFVSHRVLLFATLVLSIAARERPNIILFLTDDQDVVLGGANKMPQLQKLMREEGTTFLNGFVHTPICCPSRSSILTGRYLHNGGALNNSIVGNCYGEDWRNNAEQRTFTIHAKEAGYVTSYAGKYLNQYGIKNETSVPSGWDKWFGLVGNSRYYNYTIVESNDGGATTTSHKHGDSYEKDYLPDLLANRTLAVLKEFLDNDEKPFLLVLAWPSCHAPFTPATWAEHLYDGEQAHRTPNWNASYESVMQKHWLVRKQTALTTQSEDYIDQNYRHRLETLRSVDDHILEIIVRLGSKEGVLENTFMLFTSDNGFQMGQHRFDNDKRQLYEHDIRVPFVARGPGFGRNKTSSLPVMNIDIAPTFFEAMTGSETLPRDMDGVSFFGNKTSTRRDFLVSYHGEGDPPCNIYGGCPPTDPHTQDCTNNTYHCVRTLTHKEDSIYCQFIDDDSFVEYYDMNQDKWQLDNKADLLSDEDRWRYESRLAQLRTCAGPSCR